MKLFKAIIECLKYDSSLAPEEQFKYQPAIKIKAPNNPSFEAIFYYCPEFSERKGVSSGDSRKGQDYILRNSKAFDLNCWVHDPGGWGGMLILKHWLKLDTWEVVRLDD